MSEFGKEHREVEQRRAHAGYRRAIVLMLLSLLQVHAIVYAVDFKEAPENAGSRAHRRAVLRQGVSTYALSLVIARWSGRSRGRRRRRARPASAWKCVAT